MYSPFGFAGMMPFAMMMGAYLPIAPAYVGYGGMATGGMHQGAYGAQGQQSAMATYRSQQAYPTQEPSRSHDALAAMLNHLDGFDWPLGLRVLEPEEKTKKLRREIDDAV